MKQPKRKSDVKFDGPIPGENYTSDTRNYPWHRPPDEADFVKAVDRMIKAIAKPEKLSVVLTALETGETIIDVVTGALRVNVANGRYPIDVAILAAGPVAKYIETMATKHEIEFTRGWEQKPKLLTKARIQALAGVGMDEPDEMAEEAPVQEPMDGLMGQTNTPAPADTQNAMLGYGEDEQETLA